MNIHRPHRRTKLVFLAIPLAVVVLLLLAAAVGIVAQTQESDGGAVLPDVAGERTMTGGSEPGDPGTGVVLGDGGVAVDKSAGDVAALPEPLGYGPDPLDASRFIIRNGDLLIYVDEGDVAESAARVTTLTTGLNGYVASSQIALTGDDGRPFAAITVRVPSRSYDQAIARFGELGTVESLTTSSQDVTAEYVDVEARLKHQRAVVARLIGFLSRTTTIGEAMAVQQKIDAAQLKLEQLTAQLKSLRNQAAYGTLTVSITEPHEEPSTAEDESRFVAALSDSWNLIIGGFAVIIVAFGAVLPFIVLIAVVTALTLIAIRTARRLRQRPAPTA